MTGQLRVVKWQNTSIHLETQNTSLHLETREVGKIRTWILRNFGQKKQKHRRSMLSLRPANGRSTTQVTVSHLKASSSSQKDASSSSSSSKFPETSSSANKLKRKRSEAEQSRKIVCGICMDTKAPSEMFSNAKACRHKFCSDCIGQHVSVKIKSSVPKVTCPDPKCKVVIGPELCRSILPKKLLQRWEDALCESLILASQKFYCPFKNCSAVLVDDGGEVVTSSECPNCHRLFCAQCKVAWHSGLDCREFKRLKKGDRNPEDLMLKKLAEKKKWQRCPKCKIYVAKRSGCNHITCRCGYEFCYGCGKKHHANHVCRLRD